MLTWNLKLELLGLKEILPCQVYLCILWDNREIFEKIEENEDTPQTLLASELQLQGPGSRTFGCIGCTDG